MPSSLDLLTSLADATGLPASKAKSIVDYLLSATSQSDFDAELAAQQQDATQRSRIQEVVAAEHERTREQLDQIIELLRLRSASPPPTTRIKHQYIVGQGLAALTEIAGDRTIIPTLESAATWRLPPLIYAEQLVAALQSFDQNATTFPDLERLRGMGAPIPASWTYRSFPGLAGALKLGVPEAALLERGGDHWEPIDGWPCDGSSSFDHFGALAQPVRAWALERLERRTSEFGGEELRLPIALRRAPTFVALVVSHAGCEQLIVHADTHAAPQRVAFPVGQLDGRDLVIPIGTYFEESDSIEDGCSFERERIGLDPSEEDDELSDKDLESSTILHDANWITRQRFVGPVFLPRTLRADDREVAQVRPPRAQALYERISGCWSGASCPEVFMRTANEAWRHLGPILVGALGQAQRRVEEWVLPETHEPGVEVILRELPGEVARVSAQLIARGAGVDRIIARAPTTVLDSRTVLRLTPDPPFDGAEQLVLSVEGYYELC